MPNPVSSLKPLQQSLPPAPAPAVPSKMTLAGVTRGKQDLPYRLTLYGTEGVGKTTFGAGAPKPIYLAAESGTHHVDVARFPKPDSWADVLEAVRVLKDEKHDYQTVVLDTLDVIEPLIWQYMVKRDTTDKVKLRDVESYGYGKGFEKALDEWRILLARLEALTSAKGMHVVLLAHSWVKSFKNPEGDDYDRYEMKLNNKASGLIKGWSDAVLFARYETYAHKDDKKRVRGVDTGARLLYTERRAAYDAKNRFFLPSELPLSWADFDAAARRVVDPEEIRVEIVRKAAELGGDIPKQATELVAKAGDSIESLITINNRLNARLVERAEQAANTEKES